ncbi:NAD-dependent epimerase/dehydratase family protein [Salinispira pacifica]
MSRTFSTHVILGAGGAVSQSLVPELVRNRQEVLLVSRSGTEMSGTRSARADLTDRAGLEAVIPEGSAVYLLAGLPYDVRVWKETWPRIMDNVIEVCRQKRSLFIFFDNVYSYGLVEGPMTEDTPYKPSSRKGEIRATIAERLTEEYTSGRLDAIIARSADFYGPGAEKSGIPNILIFSKLAEGKSARWLGRLDRVHSLTYTSDCGRALPLLVADETAYNQVWHLPTAHPPMTMQRFVEIAAAKAEAAPKVSALSGWMVGLAGLFDRTTKELSEMLYQNTRDYLFDSTKFEKHFSFTPTSYEQGITETVNYYNQLRGV